MKFGEHLQKNIFLPWKNEYIQYEKLKHFLKERQLSFTGWMETDEEYFLEKLVSVEIDRVFEFINLKLRQIDSRLLELQTVGSKVEFEAELPKIAELSRFIELNGTGFQKIIKKHDKWTHIDLSQHNKIRTSHQKFKTYQFRVGQLRNDINRKSLLIENSNAIQLPVNEKPSVTTLKYWIHPDHLSEVQAILLFHLQKKSESATAAIKPTHAVYFDNTSRFPLYSDLIQRKEGAESLYFKRSDSDVFVTRKTYRSSWRNNTDSAKKDQFSLDPNQVDIYLNGQLSPELIIAQQNQNSDKRYATDTSDLNAISSSIRELIHEKQLTPILRCSYIHSRYQAPYDSGLQVSLDTDIMFVDEQQVDKHQKWKNLSKDLRELGMVQDERTIQRFPFSVLEVKQQDEAENETESENTPGWLVQLIQGQLVYEVPFFSTYLHGISCFYRERLPLLPWWLNELSKDIRGSTQVNSGQNIYPEQHNAANQKDRLPFGSENNYLNINFDNETKDHRIDIATNQPKKTNYLSPIDRNGYHPDSEKVTDSSCTLTDDAPSRYGHHHADSTTGLLSHNVFSKSNIVTRIRNMKEHYYDNMFDDQEKEKDGTTMLSWLLAKLQGKDPLASSSLSTSAPPAQEIMPKRGKLKKKIEPKIFFANERTFISWLQFSALLLTVSLGLINFGDTVSKSSGGFFIIIAMFMAGYALLRFQYRSWQIRMHSNSRFDDMWGPAVLCFVLIIALIVNLGLRVNQPLPDHPNLFGQDSITDSIPFTNKTTENINVAATHEIKNADIKNHGSNSQEIKPITIQSHSKPNKKHSDDDDDDIDD